MTGVTTDIRGIDCFQYFTASNGDIFCHENSLFGRHTFHDISMTIDCLGVMTYDMQITTWNGNVHGDITMELLTENEAADIIKMSVHWLRRARHKKEPNQPPYLKIGSSIRYEKKEVMKWLREKKKFKTGKEEGIKMADATSLREKNTTGKYILDSNGDPVQCNSVTEWGKWMEDRSTILQRILSRTTIRTNPNVHVSTVFLGLDHNHCFGSLAVPILWESMVFGGESDGEQERYSTKEEAIAGHLKLVDEQRGLLKND